MNENYKAQMQQFGMVYETIESDDPELAKLRKEIEEKLKTSQVKNEYRRIIRWKIHWGKHNKKKKA